MKPIIKYIKWHAHYKLQINKLETKIKIEKKQNINKKHNSKKQYWNKLNKKYT